LENLKALDSAGYLGVDWKILLKQTLQKHSVSI